MIAYTVRCDFASATVCDAWETWLVHEHAPQVCREGALSAVVVRLDRAGESERYVLEVRYTFASREAFAAYERGPAVRLREEGLRKKGSDDVSFARSLGTQHDVAALDPA